MPDAQIAVFGTCTVLVYACRLLSRVDYASQVFNERALCYSVRAFAFDLSIAQTMDKSKADRLTDLPFNQATAFAFASS